MEFVGVRPTWYKTKKRTGKYEGWGSNAIFRLKLTKDWKTIRLQFEAEV